MLAKSLSNTWLRLALLVTAFFLLTLMFASPTVRYSKDATIGYDQPALASKSGALKTDELVRIEFQKAIDEIKLHLDEQNSWYHYKFILIGGMFALFLGQTGLPFGLISTTARRTTRRRFADVMSSPFSYSILAMAVVVAFGLDMHIRNNMFGNQTIGLWLAYHVEPSYPYAAPFYPWELFIRKVNFPNVGYDYLYKLAFSVQLHFMTIAAYLVYTIVLQQVCITFKKRQGEGKQIILFGFLLVHLSAFAFVFIAHAVNGMYEMNLIPSGEFANGWRCIRYYLRPLAGLIVLNLPYLVLLIPRSSVRRNDKDLRHTRQRGPIPRLSRADRESSIVESRA